jgi:hypothetical protein
MRINFSWRLVPIFSLIVTISSCSSDRADSETPAVDGAIKFFDAATRKAFGNRQNELTKWRTPTTLRGPDANFQISTCAELLSLVKSGLSLEQSEVDREFSEYQVCLVIAVLERARAPRVSHFDHQTLGNDFLKRLNLATLRSSLYPRAPSPKDGFSFSDFTFSSVRVLPRSLILEDEDWNYGVVALAASDCNGDGTEDLVVNFYDDAKTGRYFYISTLVLSRANTNGWITAASPMRTKPVTGMRN